MAVFYTDSYQRKREDNNTYAIGAKERAKRESILEREYLCKIFRDAKDEDFGEILRNDKSWWGFYHLSEMRWGLFSWYDFKKDAVLLEVDADFGALTGGFCDRCEKVVATESSLDKARAIADRYKSRDNLEVYAGAIEDFNRLKFCGKFDYIVLNDVLERKGYGYAEHKAYLEYLDLIRSMLKPDGRILLVVTNRYGLQYWCGQRDRFTGKPFDGINHYPDGTSAYAFEKGELNDLLKEAGFHNFKYFYPLPDARVPQIICTEGHFKAENVSDRITFYDVEEETLVARERCLYADYMKNGVFGYFANSFLVEIPLEGACSDINYAIVSVDRGEERSFATIIYDDIVRKRPLFRKAETTMRLCVGNMEQIKQHGVKIVEHRIEDNSIKMPYVEGVTLAALLREAAKSDQDKFYQLFDLLYDNILRSSDHLGEGNDDEGPILKECYFDMVPANCFYKDGELQFFDQEFVRYEYPAKYTLYRAIKYVYMSMWELDDYIPKRSLIEKYRLTKVWDKFEKEEDDFITSLRNTQVNGQLHIWSHTDERKIYNRGEWLQFSGHDTQIPETPAWRQKIQLVQLRLLRKFIQVCEKYGLQYYAYHGTLLGAVRHQGFVPWDDDTDVVMPREDYDKLMEIAGTEFQNDFFLQTPKSDPDCFYGYSRLRYTASTAIEVRNWRHNVHQGIWLDIQPLDYVFADQEQKDRLCDEIHEIQRMILAKVYGEQETFPNIDDKTFKKYKKRVRHYSHEQLLDMFKTKLTSVKADYVAVLASYHLGDYLAFPQEYFGRGIKMPFEELEVVVPNHYDKILTRLYGDGYYQIPPAGIREKEREVFFNADVAYKEYLHRFMDIFDGYEQKEYIIVGTSELADTFIDQNRKQIKIAFVASDDSTRDIFWGYPVKKIEEIHRVPEEKRKVVICERYFRESEDILQNAGIYDYYIYIHDKWWLMGNEA